MEESDEIVNKVAASGLITVDLEDLYPKGERVVFDIAPLLWQGLVLKEKEFREYIKIHPWESYKDKYVAVICSADALVPTWAYMLLATKLQPQVRLVHFGSPEEMEVLLYREVLNRLDLSPYIGAKVVVKGCSKIPVPMAAYVELTRLLTPLVSSLMFGEPCSTVPLYKKK